LRITPFVCSFCSKRPALPMVRLQVQQELKLACFNCIDKTLGRKSTMNDLDEITSKDFITKMLKDMEDLK